MRYIFGDYELDTARHELLHADSLVKLQPKAFQVLAYLASHRDRIVPKSELRANLWPSVVGEDALTTCVMAARRAVGDDGRAQGVIKTVRGLGYRFVAPVREGGHDLGEALSAAAAESEVGAEAAGPAIGSADAMLLDPSMSPSVPGGLATEQKTVTFLACTIVQAKDLTNRLGPEAMHEQMDALFVHARAVVDRYEGSLVQWLGDSILALFGAPLARDDDARRAVLASLELLGAPKSRDSSTTESLLGSGCGVSVGLHTGAMIVGRLAEESSSGTYAVRGSTTDLAVQLQSAAPPGTVLMSESTFRLVAAAFEAEPWVGNGGVPPSYRLLGAIKHRARGPRRLRHQVSRFVGRTEQLAILHERMARAERSDGQVISITGVPGVGKSRLLDEFRIGLTAKNVTYLEGQCLPYGKSTSYLPLIDLVRQLCGVGDTLEAADTTVKVRAYLERAQATEEEGSLLLTLLGLRPDRELPERLSPQARRVRTFAILQKLVFDASAARPVVIVVEDLHWIDATSEEWLNSFVARLGNAAVLLLVTYRPPYSPDWLGRLSATQLALRPLTDTDSTILVQSILTQQNVKQEVAGVLVAKAEGNPLFLEELTHALDASSDGSQPVAIPNTVQAALASRIDQLDPVRKQLLQTCSIIGTPIHFDLLRHVTALNADALDPSLGMLEEIGFLFEMSVIPARTYRFKHALTQEAAYQSLPQGIRAQLHARIAEILESHFTDIVTTRPEVVARHHTRSGNAEAGVRYWQRAAREAFERSANVEAISYATEGLELLTSSAIEEGRAEKELSLQLTLAPALMAAKGYGAPVVGPVYTRARSLCEDTGDAQRLFRALVGLWNFYWVSGDLGRGRSVAMQLLSLARRANDPARELRAHAAMGEILLHIGELEASLQHLQQGIALYEATPRRSFATQIPAAVCLCYAAWALWHLGYSDQSLVRAEEAIALADDLSHPMSLAVCLSLKAELHQFRLEVTECLEVAERAVAVSREQGFPFWEGTALIMLGWAQAMDGDFDLGHRTMEEGLEVYIETGARVQRTAWHGMLAEIHCHSGQFDDGLREVEEALAWVGRTGEHYYHSELHRLKGELLRGLDENANARGAEQAFESALEIARRQGVRMRELRAAVSLARLLRDQRRNVEALTLIQPAQSWFGDATDSHDVKTARAILSSLS